jgi:phospholipid-binding lipoprotein MlaA
MIHKKLLLAGASLCFFTLSSVSPIAADDGPKPAHLETASQEYETEEVNDPLEPLNRVLYAIGGVIDTVIFRPFAFIYRDGTPDCFQKGVSNVIDNLFSPVTFANHVLQGEPERAGITLVRTILNTSLGLFGLLDAGEDLGFHKHETSFTETLMVWGIDSGPYIYLPIFGGTTLRGLAGLTGDYYMNPVNWYFNNKPHRDHRGSLYVRDGLDALGRRAMVIDLIDDLERTSPDLYVTLRSIHFQRIKYRRQVLAGKAGIDPTETTGPTPGKLEDTPRPSKELKVPSVKTEKGAKEKTAKDIEKKEPASEADSKSFDAMVKIKIRR